MLPVALDPAPSGLVPMGVIEALNELAARSTGSIEKLVTLRTFGRDRCIDQPLVSQGSGATIQ